MKIKKEVFLEEKQPNEELDYIRKQLGLKEGEPDKGVSAWIRDAVQQKIDREKNQRCNYCNG